MTSPPTASQFRKILLFGEMADHQLLAVMARSTTRQYPKGHELLSVHDSNTDVFFILSGRVQVRNYSQSGREFIYSEISAGGIFGEFSAIDGKPRSASVTAIEDSIIARMTSSEFLLLLESDFQITLRVLKLLTAKSRGLSARLLERCALSMRDRVHAELARLASEGKQNGASVTIQPAPTHYELAARVGSHREAVTKELSNLETLGYIRARRKQIVILDLKRFQDDLLARNPA
jgi:CRP/FNR family transcriptional regulator, cyclic AMP receptor protein